MAKKRTQASNAAQYRYNAAKIKRVPLDMQKSYYNDILKPAAEQAGESVNGFIKTAIAERIDRLKSQDYVMPFPDPPEETTREPVDWGA